MSKTALGLPVDSTQATDRCAVTHPFNIEIFPSSTSGRPSALKKERLTRYEDAIGTDPY